MASLHLEWDNTALEASGNTTSQRAYKRLKSVGGAYDNDDFTPANDMPKTTSEAEAQVIANRIYQFYIESLCKVGGPTVNDNGLVEGLRFECLRPAITADLENVYATVDLAGTDITKVMFTLRKVSDDTVLGSPVLVVRSGDGASQTWSSVSPDTYYYVETEYYATVNGVEIISSDAGQIGEVCGSAEQTAILTTNVRTIFVLGQDSPTSIDDCTTIFTMEVYTTVGHSVTITSQVTKGAGISSPATVMNVTFATPLYFDQVLSNSGGTGDSYSEITFTATNNTTGQTLTHILKRFNSNPQC